MPPDLISLIIFGEEYKLCLAESSKEGYDPKRAVLPMMVVSLHY
jgi:hypothetical protein